MQIMCNFNQPQGPRSAQYWIAKKQQDKQLKPDFLKKEGKKDSVLKMDTEEVARQTVEATLLKAIEGGDKIERQQRAKETTEVRRRANYRARRQAGRFNSYYIS